MIVNVHGCIKVLWHVHFSPLGSWLNQHWIKVFNLLSKFNADGLVCFFIITSLLYLLRFYYSPLLIACHYAALMPLRQVNGLFVCIYTGACGVSVPHHFHGGGVPEGNSLRPALPPQRLPEERLESARLHHRSCRVSDQTHSEKRKSCDMLIDSSGLLQMLRWSNFIDSVA